MRTNHLFILILFFVFSIAKAQNVSVTIENSVPMEICNQTTTQLKARVNFESTLQGATISVVLPEGITYIPGSITRTATNKPNELKIQESDTKNRSKPIFKVTGQIVPADWIEFTLQKTANCLAYTTSNKNQVFIDQVTVQLGNESKTEKSNSYTLNYPNFSMTTPAVQNEAIPNKTYTRSFTVTNGGTTFANAVYLDIEYDKDIKQEQKGLRLRKPDGIKITEHSINGTIHRYVIDGNLLGSDKKFSNGETLTFYEDYSIKACNTTTNYTTSWGCDTKNPCQTAKTTAQVNLIAGTPKIDTFYYGELKNYVNGCTPFGWSVTFTNTGTPNISGAMYNTIFRLGGSSSNVLEGFDWAETNIIEASVGGVPVPGFTKMDKRTILALDFTDKLTPAQVKGKELGLRDIDGDGFVDDLPAGASITIDFKVKIGCNVLGCGKNLYNNYGVYGDVQYTSICGEKIDTKKLYGQGGYNIGGDQIDALNNNNYAPSNVYNGINFDMRFSLSYHLINNHFDRANTRYYYQIELPPGLSLIAGSEKWYYGKYPDNINTPLKPNVKQEGNILTVTSPDKSIGYFIANFVYKCTENNKGGKIEIPYTLKRIDDIVGGCTTCNNEIFCGTVTIENAVCPSVCNSGGPSLTLAKVERANNSLGYTNTEMKVLQKRQNISAYDLSKALYLDDIEVTAKAKQLATKRDLFLKFSIKKLGINLKADRLQAKKISYTITRPGDPKSPYKGTLSIEEALTHTSTVKEEIFLWDFTSVLPDGKIQAGDEIETKATYIVISNDMPNHDEQMGKEIYFYNTDSGGYELFCNTLVPEMYLVSLYFENASNGLEYFTMKGCEVKNIGSGINHIAYRFDTEGVVYLSEIRPGFLPQTYSFVLPDGVEIDKLLFINSFPYEIAKTEDITTKLVKNGSTYTYYFTEDAGYNTPITNVYNLVMQLFLKPTCKTPTNGTFIETDFTYLPYWYHYKVRNQFPETD